MSRRRARKRRDRRGFSEEARLELSQSLKAVGIHQAEERRELSQGQRDQSLGRDTQRLLLAEPRLGAEVGGGGHGQGGG